ncbi:Alpha/Beta hydrolase protein [Mycena floridula]|nr:Alpha/Beta hydrolase protein [Mycena floridula]
MASPALPSIFDVSTVVQKGLCPVTEIRNKGDPTEQHSLYFEQHGTGQERILFIMGMNSSSFSWDSQVVYFSKHYSVLVFDNRGVGNSGVPRGPYTTSGMAEDVITLLNYVGWTEGGIHVVGLSLGGMIAQELATRIPSRIRSLVLGVTTPGGHPWTNFPPWKGIYSLARITFTADLNVKIPILLEMVFPLSWLDAKAANDPAGRTNRQIESESYLRRIQITRPQSLFGALSQMAAALTHHVTPERLQTISATIPKVLIVTGDDDLLVDPSNSRLLKQHMKEAQFVEWKNCGHAIHFQERDRFNALLDQFFKAQ